MTNNNIEPVFEKGYPNYDAVNKKEGYYDYMLRESREADRKIYMENKVQRSIWVTFKKEGIHKYPAALEDPKLATGDEYDVSFLGYPHRHIFHFKVQIEVPMSDIEFIPLKRWLELYNESLLSLIISPVK